MASDFPIIGKLGGRETVTGKLRKRGHKIGRDALRMWTARGSIPGDATRLLMQIADDERVPYSAADFDLVADDEAPSSRAAAAS
jgi:hypothetical protein